LEVEMTLTGKSKKVGGKEEIDTGEEKAMKEKH
jgi:hypothetical protein